MIETAEAIQTADLTTAPFQPFPWQVAPWQDQSPVLLLTGAAGGGKSILASEKMHGFLLAYPGSTGVGLRKAGEYAYKSIVPLMQHAIGDDPSVKVKTSLARIDYSNGSVFYWAGMKDVHQREALRSLRGKNGDPDIVWMEEANAFTREDYDEAGARLRGRGADWTQLILSTNPDYPEHWIYTDLILGRQASVYYSNAHDNPTNTPAYFARLDALTGVLRARLRDGQWVRAEGVVFDEFDAQVHLIDAFDIPSSWRRIRCVDFGYTNPFVCYDDQTETLTDQGWMKFSDLNGSELVGTVNPESHQFEFQKPISYISQRYSGQMVTSQINSRNGVDFCVTPNHKMVLENRKSGRWGFYNASEMVEDRSIPVAWNPENKKMPAHMPFGLDALGFPEFLGLWLAEGSLHNNGLGSVSLRIAQKEYIDEVRNVIHRAGLHASEYTNKNGVVEFSISGKPLYDWIVSNFGMHTSRDKYVADFCFSFNYKQMEAFIKGFELGDGRKGLFNAIGKRIGTRTLFTTSRRMADDLQRMLCQMGIASKVTKTDGFSMFTGKSLSLYKVLIHQAKGAHVKKLPIRTMQYDGMIYCVTVPNRTLVVRRNGRPMVCGNCQWWALDNDGRAFRYREIYRTHRTVEEHAEDIKNLSEGEKIETTVCDHDAEDSATLRRHGIPTTKAFKEISTGLQAVQKRLKEKRLFYFRGALVEEDPTLIEERKPTCTEQEFAGYIWPKSQDGKPIKEVPVKVNDHGMDDTRYLVCYIDPPLPKAGAFGRRR